MTRGDGVQDMSGVQAVILAGGKGTRLKSVVADRPKVLAEVIGRPFICHLLEYLASFGIRRAILCTGYKSEIVRDTLGDRQGDISLEYSVEAKPLDTAGAVRLALPLISSDPVLVMNGDSFFAADLAEFYGEHMKRQASASLMLSRVDDVSRYGSVLIDDDGKVLRFAEKQSTKGAGLISAGIYLLSCGVLSEIPAGRPVSFETEVFPGLVGRGLYGHIAAGSFLDIGTPESYAAAESFLSGIGQHQNRCE